VQISPLQMSCQACGNTQQLDLHFFAQAAQAKPPAKDHSWPEGFTKVTTLPEISDGEAKARAMSGTIRSTLSDIAGIHSPARHTHPSQAGGSGRDIGLPPLYQVSFRVQRFRSSHEIARPSDDVQSPCIPRWALRSVFKFDAYILSTASEIERKSTPFRPSKRVQLSILI